MGVPASLKRRGGKNHYRLTLLLALLLASAVARFKTLFRLSYFVPYAIPGIIGALLWSFLYLPQFSPIVKGLESIGIQVDFLGPKTILWSIANIVTWEFAGYNMLIIYAALQAIPSELYESARLDGCSGFKVARYIKIPLLGPTLVLTAIFSIIGTLQLSMSQQCYNKFRIISLARTRRICTPTSLLSMITTTTTPQPWLLCLRLSHLSFPLAFYVSHNDIQECK